VGDEATVVWGLGKDLGDEVDYTDERGRSFRLRIVGVLANSVLQGSLLISEERFIRRFPSQGGYRAFLIDAPVDGASRAMRALSGALEDEGADITPAGKRLGAFNMVQNTYLAIFQALGGLGLLLGSVGLGVVVMRNVLERRSELALLRAVGFGRGALHLMILLEHWGLLAGGLCSGVVAALLAVLPVLRSGGTGAPWALLALILTAVAASGAGWIALATHLALRGPLLDALRTE
ncbi:unnamed protein product, partial [marine sediment metagenome]